MSINLRSLCVPALVVPLLLGSLALSGVWTAGAAGPPGQSVFVPMEPCRLFDYRPAPDTVGPRTSPLGPGEVHTQQVTGAVGNCNVPAGATGVAMNITAVAPTAQSNLRLFPADQVTPPLVSNLNFSAGQAPVPNKVDVKLSPAGAVKIRNHAGRVFVIGDVAGYYATTPLTDLEAAVAALEARSTTRFAKVDADANSATLLHGPDVTAVGWIAPGVYSVTFSSSVIGCAWNATRNDNSHGVALPGEIAIELGSSLDQTTLWVRTYDSAGAAADMSQSDGFSLLVTC